MKILDTYIGELSKVVEIGHDQANIENNQFKIDPINNRCYLVGSDKEEILVEDVIQLDSGKFRVEIGIYTIDVHIVDPINLAIIGEEKQRGDVYAPMAGQISKILVKIDDVVSKGEYLVIISAMKMENQISSPIDGVIKQIFVNVGNHVESGKLLVEIEPK